MSWTLVILVLVPALGAIAGIHLWWQARFVAAQKAAEEEKQKALREREESARQLQVQQNTLFNSMAEGLILLDQTGRIQLANRSFSKLFQLTNDVRGRTLIEALRLPELAAVAEALESQDNVLGFELRIPPPHERWLEVNGAAILNGEGSRHGAILVFHDLTTLKQLEVARKDFVANVSHELRTPLSLIKGYVETLLDGAINTPEVATKFLRTIDRNAERLKLLIEDLLTLSALESGRVTLNLQPLLLRPAVEKIFTDLKTKAETKEITLINDTNGIEIQADPDRLEQVLNNLLENAIKYGRQGGTARVRARAIPEGQVEVCVEDDGQGIPAESVERVFERFYRVDKARSRDQGGTGLGLSIVKHIVQSHGGKVWARSEPSRGTEIFFTLPAIPSDGRQAFLPLGKDQ